MPKIETVEVNGVIVNKGEEEAAAKWGKGKKTAEAEPEIEEADALEVPEAPKKGSSKKS